MTAHVQPDTQADMQQNPCTGMTWRTGREKGREGEREEGGKGGREEGREGGRKEGRKGGREGGRKGGREGGRIILKCLFNSVD